MRLLGRLAPAVLAALAFAVACIPILAVLMLGAPGVSETAKEPVVVRAAIASLQAAGIVFGVGWPTGVLAAFGIWGARPVARRVVLGGASLALVIAAAVSGHDLRAPIAASITPIAAAAALVTLLLTGALNRIDPRLLLTGAACGAAPVYAWLTVLAALRPMLILTAAASFALGLVLCTRMQAEPALAGLLNEAIRQADVAVAPEALMLGLLSLAPWLVAGLLVLPGRVFRRS